MDDAEDRCASLPAGSLASLAGLRREGGVRVVFAGDRAWVAWASRSASVLERLRAVRGAWLYEKREGRWYPRGRSLPEFSLPVDAAEGVGLARGLTPSPARPEPPPSGPIATARLTLVRDGRRREATAMRCGLNTLADWAETATSARLESLRASVSGSRVLLIGRPLPPLFGDQVERYWGEYVLSPLGWRPEPDLPERAVVRALGAVAGAGDVVIFTSEGGEVAPGDAFGPLSRAGGEAGERMGVMTAEAVDDYLGIPEEYGLRLGGLRWSVDGEAVELMESGDEPGRTFAMGAEIALLLEGLATGGRLPHFAHVLHMLALLGFGRSEVEDGGGSTLRCPALAKAFQETGRPLRNAGSLFAVLCLDVPSPPDPPDFEAVRRRLLRMSTTYRVVGSGALMPSIDAPTFEERMRRWIEAMSAAELRYWLRKGRQSLDGAGEDVARLVPPTLGEVLDDLENRPRLRGTAGLVKTLAGAISLPPRRLTASGMPMGGYADLTTRGHLDRILPTQLALEPDEFLRRFAAGELLYYEREEPREPSTRELILVVDQGPRTWGETRLVLAAATIALARQAGRAGLSVKVATTGNGGRAVEPEGIGSEAFGTLLETSDLSASPAKALGKALREGGARDISRDVVLLTHPRNLLAEDVRNEAWGVVEPSRLFGLTADAEGSVTLSTIREGGTTTLGRCRVELAARAEDPRARAIPGEAAGWSGDVERVPFPFRVGAVVNLDDRLMAFDDAAKWLLAADPHGFLRASRVDGSGWEMLPRARVEGRAMERVEAVVGVAGGFVVVGWSRATRAAAHYNFPERACKVHPIHLSPLPDRWEYDRDRHTLVGRMGMEAALLAIDLHDSPGHATFPSPGAGPKAAFFAAKARSPLRVTVVDVRDHRTAGPVVCLDKDRGTLTFREANGHCQDSEFPSSFGGKILAADLKEGTLAILTQSKKHPRVLSLFSTDQGRGLRLIGELSVAEKSNHFSMSRDGRWVAWNMSEREISVSGLENLGAPRVVVPRGKAHEAVGFLINPNYLTVQGGRHAHLIRWDRGALEFRRETGPMVELAIASFRGRRPSTPFKIEANESSIFDALRFRTRCDLGGVTVASDRLGQVAICVGERVLAMFLVFRDRIAAWGADGTRLGPPEMTGGAPTAGGEARLAEILRSAPWGEGA